MACRATLKWERIQNEYLDSQECVLSKLAPDMHLVKAGSSNEDRRYAYRHGPTIKQIGGKLLKSVSRECLAGLVHLPSVVLDQRYMAWLI